MTNLHHWSLSLGFCVACMNTITLPQALAQITPDNSLGSESSVVNTDVNVRGGLADLIEGGAIREAHLFHSFSEFNIGELQRVYFANPVGIQNIFSRVTGGNLSEIFGTLGVDGGANLFLINPNGIHFGPNASLDISGSFFASTTDRIVFNNGYTFNATDTAAPPLLLVNVPSGLQQGTGIVELQPGDILNEGNLAVGSQATLSLSGQTVTSSGSLTAPGGTVQVLGSQVNLIDHAQINVSDQIGGGNVFLGGNIQGKGPLPNAQQTFVGSEVKIHADALTTGDGGNVIVFAQGQTDFYGRITARGGPGGGNGGFVEISGQDQLTGNFFGNTVDTSAVHPENYGTLLIDPVDIIIASGTGDGGTDGNTSFVGNPSNITGSVNLTDTAPTIIFESELEGLGGNTDIILQASNDITIQDLGDDVLNFQAGAGNITFTADADSDGVGDFTMVDTKDTLKTTGRNLIISGANLVIGNVDTTFPNAVTVLETVNVSGGGTLTDDGTTIFTFTVSSNQAVEDLDVRFSASHTWDADLQVDLESPQKTTLELISGVGGDGDNFQDTLLDDSAPQSINEGVAPFDGSFQPSGTGGLDVFAEENPAGDWTLRVTDTFPSDTGTLYQAGEAAPWGTALGTQLIFNLLDTTVGKSGNITLNATSNITASNLQTNNSAGLSGNISLNGNILTFNNGSLNASTIEGDAGSITLNATGNILLNNSSIISNSVQGDPGLIDLTAVNSVQIIGDGAVTGNNSFIETNSDSGLAGSITISANKVDLQNTILNARVETTSDTQTTTDNDGSGLISITATDMLSVTNTRINTNALGQTSLSEPVPNVAGNILLTGGTLNLNSVDLTSSADNGRLAGFIDLRATTGSATLLNTTLNAQGSASLEATALGAVGNGSISVNSPTDLTLTNTLISVNVDGQGFAGNITLSAGNTLTVQTIFDTNDNVNNSVSNIFDQGSRLGSNASQGVAGAITLNGAIIAIDNSRFTADGSGFDTGVQQAGGFINLTATDTLTLNNDTLISSSTSGSADAGFVTLAGANGVNLTDSRIESTVKADASGAGEGVRILGNAITLDSTTVDVSTSGTGNGGSISIGDFVNTPPQNATVTLTNGSTLNATTASGGNAGTIQVSAINIIIEDTSILAGVANFDTSVVDTELFLFDAGGNLLAENDDSETTAGAFGSNTTSDSFINYLFDRDGTYIIGVGQFDSVGEDNTGITGAPLEVGSSYKLQVSVDNANGGGSGTLAEVESNDSLETAQPLDGNFILGANPNVESSDTIPHVSITGTGDGTFDYYAFSATNGSRGIFDIDETLGADVAVTGNSGNIILNAAATLGINNSRIDNRIEDTPADTPGFIDLRGDMGVNLVNTVINGRTNGSATGGNVTIITPTLELEGTTIDLGALSSGHGGSLDINVSDTVTLTGSSILANTSQTGNGGDLSIITNQLNVDNTQINARANEGSQGIGGDVQIQANTVSITNQSVFDASTSGSGNGGIVTIQVNNDGPFLLDNSQISTTTFTTARAGNISIAAGTITTQNNAVINAGVSSDLGSLTGGGEAGNIPPQATQAGGNAGNVTINSRTLNLNDQAQISASNISGTIGGDVRLNGLETLTLNNNSAISASTETGIAGNVTINYGQAPVNTINISGEGSRIVAEATREGGEAGFVNLNTLSLTLTDQALISASNVSGQLGNDDILLDNLDTLTLSNGGEISASTKTGTAGFIQINDAQNPVDTLNISGNRSRIVAQATEAGGTAGNVTINSTNLTLNNQAQISTSNISGNVRGDVVLNGLETLTINGSEISASTVDGIAGNIEVNIDNTAVETIDLDSGAIIVVARAIGSSGNIDLNVLDLNLDNESTISAANVSEINIVGSVLLDNLNTLDVNNSRISASTDSGRAGSITLNATESINLADNASILVSANEGGNAGNILLTTPQLTLDNGSRIGVRSNQGGNAGQLNLNAQRVQLTNQSLISGATEAGQGDNITFPNLNTLTITNSRISAATGSGQAGDLTLNATESVTLTGKFQPGSGGEGGLLVSAMNGGNAGSILLTTPELILDNRAQISVRSNQGGNGGQLNIDAQTVQLTNQSVITGATEGGQGDNLDFPTLNTLNINNSTISASTVDGIAGLINLAATDSIVVRGMGGISVAASGQGQAGSIDITTTDFTLTDGAIISASNRDGTGGSINLTASNRLTVNNGGQFRTTTLGTANAGSINLDVVTNITLSNESTGIFATTAIGSSGNGGNIIIDPETVVVEDGAQIATNSLGSGQGGSINLTAGNLTLDNGFLTAETASNRGGEITLNLDNFLQLLNNSTITATAGTEQAGGDGGNVNLTSRFVVAFPSPDGNGNDIIANAFTGNGGQINITAESIFGLAQRLSIAGNGSNDIDASSQFGASGTITINTSFLDPGQGLLELPADVTDPSERIVAGCAAADGSSFTVTGSGGLPEDPTTTLRGQTLITDFRDFSQNTIIEGRSPSSIPSGTIAFPTPLESIIEAQGWRIGETGKIILTAQPVGKLFKGEGWQNSLSCQYAIEDHH